MRLDKFLKVSRLVKRRTVANDVCSSGRVLLNGRKAKPSADVKTGDVLEIAFGTGASKIRILDIRETVRKNEAEELYELIEDGRT